MARTSSDPLPPAWTALFGAWLLATVATLGSLFFSDVMALTPCALCWYQRIFMFPLPLVLLAGLLPHDPRAPRYGLPLAVVGAGIALWHVLIYEGVLPESAAPCSAGVSCAQPTFELFGLLSIPALSLLGFLGIAALLVLSLVLSARSAAR